MWTRRVLYAYKILLRGRHVFFCEHAGKATSWVFVRPCLPLRIFLKQVEIRSLRAKVMSKVFIRMTMKILTAHGRQPQQHFYNYWMHLVALLLRDANHAITGSSPKILHFHRRAACDKLSNVASMISSNSFPSRLVFNATCYPADADTNNGTTTSRIIPCLNTWIFVPQHRLHPRRAWWERHVAAEGGLNDLDACPKPLCLKPLFSSFTVCSLKPLGHAQYLD